MAPMETSCRSANSAPRAAPHYAEDLGYWQTKGFYEVTDWLQANVPGFSTRTAPVAGGSKITVS